MKIKIENKEFELNVEEAKRLNLLRETIKTPEVGDVWEGKYNKILILKNEWNKDSYIFAGISGLLPYSNDPKTLKDLREFLLDNNYKFIRNINENVKKLISG